MRRSRAILFFGSLTLLIIGYLCWAARPFIIRPRVEFAAKVPGKEQKIIKTWLIEFGGFGPEKFDFRRYVLQLMHPYETAMTPAIATFSAGDSYTPEHVVLIRHPKKPYHMRFSIDRMSTKFRVTFH